ncbi:phosphoinositide biosynthesis protein [Schizosaccharomyces japonicus yFS275]|uniref:Phosphoinositide biosynthesis protein n=1 Tax=Schizosaccharomyces japonicus (strain yFS275 / FY16936) TaxID=402676 RepID=B6JZZ1_SCHJY|nr:phosphoinositide biosynthesis protein [Schizosaccharomyces japonicus yFS275]EEB06141.1 phosphoinositide biosynthesis protein [Schizosaccharomyces japonicus yFS275]
MEKQSSTTQLQERHCCLRKRNIILAGFYAATLLLGGLYNVFVNSTLGNYFGSSKNFLNVFFVKKGWFWTTVVYFVHAIVSYKDRYDMRVLLRYGAATMWWFFITQWFLGPAITDRAFAWTGGSCKGYDITVLSISPRTSALCRSANGLWHGGHDLSGHVFLLTHASLFLISEFWSTLSKAPFKTKSSSTLVGLLAFWWWMLFMTAIHYHTFLEKLTGFLAALTEWAIMYDIVPRVPFLDSLFGVSDINA